MNLNENVTLNRITDILKEVAECHSMLCGFEVGETAARGYSDKEKKELCYPYLWVDYGDTLYNVTANRTISDKVYNMRLFVADKHSDNIKSDDEIMSDTEGILSDVIQWILTYPELKKILVSVGTISATPAREATKDDVFGWIATIPIRIPYKFCYSDLPIVEKP